MNDERGYSRRGVLFRRRDPAIALSLACEVRPLPDDALMIVGRGRQEDDGTGLNCLSRLDDRASALGTPARYSRSRRWRSESRRDLRR